MVRALDDFYRIYTHTAERAGFVARARRYYDRVWELFARSGHARLAFATLEGERVATLFHFTCGDRVAEAFGGMTDEGAESRANYLLKWSAITGFKTDGFRGLRPVGPRDGRHRPVQGGVRRTAGRLRGRPRPAVAAAPRTPPCASCCPPTASPQRTRLRLAGRHLAGSQD